MTDWFEELRQKSVNFLNAAREMEAESWLRRSVVEKYAESTHFIFELLQNADDQEATKVEFKLHPDRVEFYHWGKPFKRDDVKRIVRLGDSAKPGEVHKIGRFGIGFKSVFAVTDRPEVYCKLENKPFAFAVESLIVPVALAPVASQGEETKFVLHYAAKAGKSPSSDAADQLTKAGPETLMFLNHIEELSWQDESGKGERFVCVRGSDGVLLLERSGHGASPQEKRKASSYKVFRSNVTLPDGAPSEICVAFRLNSDGKAINEDGPTKLWVYFETEEQIGLRFRLHGPFKLTDNRANIMRREEFNRHLIGQLAELSASSLGTLRDEGRLIKETLNAFPIPADDVPEVWQEVAEAIWQAAKEDEILPTAAGGHANPSGLFQGTQELRDVFTDADLTLLADEDVAWAVTPGLRNSRIDRLLSHLETPELNLENLIEKLQAASMNRGRLETWLAGHDPDWMQQFYLILNGAKGYQTFSLGRLSIVRAADGAHVSAANVRFAPAGEQKDQDVEVQGVRLVAPSILAGKKELREEVKTFLTKIGVKDVDEQDYIRALLDRHYRQGSRASDMKAHLQHVERFAAWLATHPHQKSVFQGYTYLLSDVSDLMYAPTQLYFDKPFQETGLSAIYGDSGPWRKQKYLLAKRYRSTKGVLDFARALGVIQHLQPDRTTTNAHPERNALWADYYRASARMGNSTNVDWTIPELNKLLATPNIEVSLCLWRSLQSFERSCFFAQFRHAESYPYREKPASFVYQLRSIAWIPSKTGEFSKPEDITEAELPPEFETADKTGWHDAIGFGLAARRKAAEYQEQRKAAVHAGIPEEFADRFQELSEDERMKVLEAGFRDLQTTARATPDFPERNSPNPERRSAKVAEAAEAAPEKRREVRDRTVRLEPGGHRPSVREYLVDLYTNDDGAMVCQCCRQEMPFQLSDGSYYFEAIEFDSECDRELPENHLALCPVCAAKFQHARTTDEAEMRAALIETDTAEISVQLAGKDESIKFVNVHKDDLLTALRILKEKRQRSA